MTPDQLLGLQQHARARTATLSPEISIEEEGGDGVPVVIATGTQESVPIEIDEIDEVHEADEVVPLPELVPPPRVDAAYEATAFVGAARPGPTGAIIGFALFGAWTLAEILMIALM